MFKPFKHQEKGIEIGKQGSKAFFWDCGCGKSFLGLHLIKHWKSQGQVPALVVCPLSIIDAAWITDCAKFTPDLSIVSLHSKKPAERRKRLAENHDIYVANFETYKSLFPEIQAKGFKVVIVDESSKMKCPTSQITRSLLASAGIKTRAKKGKGFPVGHVIPNRYVLSGTPAPNDRSEYWSQVAFITGPGGQVFNDNFYAFRSRYFAAKPLGRTGINLYFFKKDMADEFNDKLALVSDVVSKEDAADLPEQVFEVRNVTLSDAERKAYNTMKDELMLRFAGETVLASTALVEIAKLRQLSSGFCYTENETQVLGKSKLKETKALLEEIGNQQCIIWCNFKYEIQMLLDEFGKDAQALWSETNDRDQVIRDFKANKFRLLIANFASAAHGLSFNNCSYAIDFSINFSYELWKQSRDRIHGLGRGIKGVSSTYYSLVAKDTVDEVMHRAVTKKGDLSMKVLNYLRKKS